MLKLIHVIKQHNFWNVEIKLDSLSLIPFIIATWRKSKKKQNHISRIQKFLNNNFLLKWKERTEKYANEPMRKGTFFLKMSNFFFLSCERFIFNSIIATIENKKKVFYLNLNDERDEFNQLLFPTFFYFHPKSRIFFYLFIRLSLSLCWLRNGTNKLNSMKREAHFLFTSCQNECHSHKHVK